MNRRDFLKSTVAAAAVGSGLGRIASGAEQKPDVAAALAGNGKATADSIILIWLPGGVAQTDTWDPKKHTPFEKGLWLDAASSPSAAAI